MVCIVIRRILKRQLYEKCSHTSIWILTLIGNFFFSINQVWAAQENINTCITPTEQQKQLC